METLPVAAFSLTSAIEPLVYYLQHLVVIFTQHLIVAADTVIVPVPLQLLSQLDQNLGCSESTALFLDPQENRSQSCPELLFRRFHRDKRLALHASASAKIESQIDKSTVSSPIFPNTLSFALHTRYRVDAGVGNTG